MVLATGVGFSPVQTVWSPMNSLVTGEQIGHYGHGLMVWSLKNGLVMGERFVGGNQLVAV